jgi:hypothetical protein
MNRKAATAAVVCFAAGLLTGFFIFHKSSTVQHQSSAIADHTSELPTKAPTVVSLNTSNATTKTASSASQTNRTSAVTDLQDAVRSARSSYDLSRMFRAIDQLETNQFGDALAACLKSTDLQSAAYAIRELGARWGRIDPQKSLAFATAWENLSQRPLIISGILSGWAETDPNAATSYARSLPDGQGKSQALAAVATTIASENPQTAFDLVKNLTPGYLRANLTWPLFSKWASRSPTEAAVAALQFPESYQAVGVVANVWAINDFDAAYSWAKNLPPGSTRDEAMQRTMLTLAGRDLQAATAWVNQHLSDPDVNDAASSLAGALASLRPAETANWIRSLPDGQVKLAALNGSFRALAYYDPTSTADLLSSLPESQDRDMLYQKLASQWGYIDLKAANKWVDSLPAGQLRDQVARPVASQLARTDPAAAARLVDTIQNDGIWQDAAVEVANRWLKTDADAARKWVAQSAFPEDFKKSFANQKP